MVMEHWFISRGSDFERPVRTGSRATSGNSSKGAGYALRCVWISDDESAKHDVVILYGHRQGYRSDGTQILYRSASGDEPFESLDEMGSYVEAMHVEGMDWDGLSREQALEELGGIPKDGRVSPHCLTQLTEVLLAERHQKFANVYSLAQLVSVTDNRIMSERDALREEVAIYRRQLAISGSGSTGWNIAGKDPGVPHFSEAFRIYHRLVDRVSLSFWSSYHEFVKLHLFIVVSLV